MKHTWDISHSILSSSTHHLLFSFIFTSILMSDSKYIQHWIPIIIHYCIYLEEKYSIQRFIRQEYAFPANSFFRIDGFNLSLTLAILFTAISLALKNYNINLLDCLIWVIFFPLWTVFFIHIFLNCIKERLIPSTRRFSA